MSVCVSVAVIDDLNDYKLAKKQMTYKVFKIRLKRRGWYNIQLYRIIGSFPCNTMLYMIFQFDWEPVLIQRILIGFEAILKKVFSNLVEIDNLI